eukprot:TRINITY_DN16521_c0_g1_i1.p1 TRINITY_DN16521_c0_g1~~TRINITY_DN16521_c0_g1_i1.p1  ORF type:complete len:351 (-),score=35.58 TRINITY_DN16521_c0_g1_i1:442-1494(-)
MAANASPLQFLSDFSSPKCLCPTILLQRAPVLRHHSSYRTRSNAHSLHLLRKSMATFAGRRFLGKLSSSSSCLLRKQSSHTFTRFNESAKYRRPIGAVKPARHVALAAWRQEILWTEAPLVAVEPAAESLYHVVLDAADNPDLVDGYTTPGQFVQVKVGNNRPVFLAMASPPDKSKDGFFEFLIKDIEGSTAGVLCDLKKGDTVELSQVMGDGFDVSQISPPEDFGSVFLFATGSGISPIRALLEHGLDADRRSNVMLYYGARNLKRMAYQEKFKNWESSGIQIIPVLSQPDDKWDGERGYIQSAFARAKDIQNPLSTGAVLCGHKQMTEDVTSLLVSEGIPKEKILKNF